MNGRKMTDQEKWYAEYKCPKCGYESNVTNICRSCQRVMYPTGKECRWNSKTMQDDVRGLIDAQELDFAKSWASVGYAGDMLDKKELPEWVTKVLREFFHMDLSYWEKE